MGARKLVTFVATLPLHGSFDSALRAPLRMTAVWEKMTVAVGSQDDGKGEPRAIH